MQPTSLWQIRNFRLIFGATSVGHLGSGVSMVALPWFATLLTRDPFLIGFVAMAPQLPWLLFALPFGVLTDRLDHRRTIVATEIARAALMLAVAGLAWLALSGPVAVLMLAGLAFLIGTVEVLHDNTAQTVLPSIIPKDRLEGANSAMWAAEQVTAQFIGPPFAGVLIGLGIAFAFSFDAVMLAVSAGLTALLVVGQRPERLSQDFWPALKEGVLWLWHNGPMRRLAMVLGVYNFLSTMIWSVMVLYAQDTLHLDAVGYGALLSALAFGGLAGSFAAPLILRRIGANRGLLVSVAGFILSTGLLIFTENPWVAGAALVGDAFTGMLWNIATVSYRQRNIPAQVLGRANSAYRFVGSGTRPLGSLAGGAIVALAAPLGPVALHLPFAVATFGAVLMFAYSALYLRLD